jgi:hypothetical protein
MLTNGTNDPIKENSNTSATAETPRPPPPLPAKNIMMMSFSQHVQVITSVTLSL